MGRRAPSSTTLHVSLEHTPPLRASPLSRYEAAPEYRRTGVAAPSTAAPPHAGHPPVTNDTRRIRKPRFPRRPAGGTVTGSHRRAMPQAQQLGRYLLLDRIAYGGMAEIYRAKTFDADGRVHLVAVKRVLAH